MGETRLEGDRRTQDGTALLLREIQQGSGEHALLVSQLAAELAAALFSPDRLADLVIRVSTTKRKASRFETVMTPVNDTPNNPSLLAERQKSRIELLIVNPATNSGIVYIGNKTVKAVAGPDQGIPVAPGNSFTLDTTTDAVYAIPAAGSGTQSIYCFDAVE
jgi:hypothetical protein